MQITAAIVSHNREKQLRNMIWQLENQILSLVEIRLYVSGYEEKQLVDLEQKYFVSYQKDKKDWGHEKRAIALNESPTRYMLCASDDDIYTYHFTEAVAKTAEEKPDGAIYATDWRTQREFANPDYGYHIAEPKICGVTSGCMVIDTDFVKNVCAYGHRDFGADGRFAEDVIASNGLFIRVPYMCFFHY